MKEWALQWVLEEINEILIHLISARHPCAHWETMVDYSFAKNQ